MSSLSPAECVCVRTCMQSVFALHAPGSFQQWKLPCQTTHATLEINSAPLNIKPHLNVWGKVTVIWEKRKWGKKERGFRVKPKREERWSKHCGLYSSQLHRLHLPLFLCPSPIQPLQCMPSEGALSLTHTLIRTVSTANSTSLTSGLTNYISYVCYLLLFFNQKKYLEEHSGGVLKSLPSVLFCILNNHPSSEKFPLCLPAPALSEKYTHTKFYYWVKCWDSQMV